MKQYLDLGKELLAKYNGKFRNDRTGVGTVSLFGRQMRFDLRESFPIVTTKQVYIRQALEENFWMLEGSTDNNELLKRRVTIWNEWATPDGRLGPIYGEQWRAWPSRETTEVVPYTLAERMQFAKEISDFDNDPKTALIIDKPDPPFTHYQFDHLTRMIGLGDDPQIVNKAHLILSRWGIPVGDRRRKTIDQITQVRDNLLKRPYSRRHVVTAWNPAVLPDETLSPQENVEIGNACLASCHCLFQFFAEDLELEERIAVAEERLGAKFQPELTNDALDRELTAKLLDKMEIPKYYLDCQLYQRSADFCLGVPFNIVSYAALTMMMAQSVNMIPREFVHTFGDLHVYSNHIEKLKEQVEREPMPLPKMKLNPAVRNIFDFKYEDFELIDYQHHAPIRYDVAI